MKLVLLLQLGNPAVVVFEGDAAAVGYFQDVCVLYRLHSDTWCALAHPSHPKIPVLHALPSYIENMDMSAYLPTLRTLERIWLQRLGVCNIPIGLYSVDNYRLECLTLCQKGSRTLAPASYHRRIVLSND